VRKGVEVNLDVYGKWIRLGETLRIMVNLCKDSRYKQCGGVREPGGSSHQEKWFLLFLSIDAHSITMCMFIHI